MAKITAYFDETVSSTLRAAYYDADDEPDTWLSNLKEYLGPTRDDTLEASR